MPTPSAVMSVMVFTRNMSISKSDFGQLIRLQMQICTDDPANSSAVAVSESEKFNYYRASFGAEYTLFLYT